MIKWWRRFGWIVLLLWLAFALRALQLTDIPPGLTHDEANHGREGMEVLQGHLQYYFPYNYGSEPLYSYMVAGQMGLTGQNLLSLRLVNVWFGLLALALAYRWSRKLFGPSVALLTLAVTAVSFWPLATSRQALRAGMLPFLILLAVFAFWQLLQTEGRTQRGWIVAFAVAMLGMFHNYLAARVAWVIFPLYLLYLAIWHREQFNKGWRGAVAGFLLSAVLVAPMFYYLNQNPEIQPRVQMLDSTLQAAQAGDLVPLFGNGIKAVLAFFMPGQGDRFLAYNVPGRPVLDVVTAAAFWVGIGVCLWRWRQRPYFFALLWFGIGIIPSLITGPEANTTRNMAALPVTYILAVIGFVTVVNWLNRAPPPEESEPEVESEVAEAVNSTDSSTPIDVDRIPSRLVLNPVPAIFWITFVLAATVQAYFVDWARAPEVRAAYQYNLTQMLTELPDDGSSTVISSVYPGVAHNPSIGMVLAGTHEKAVRWVDARTGLVFPGSGEGQLLVPMATPLHPAFTEWVTLEEQVLLAVDDLNPSYTIWRWSDRPTKAERPLATFGDALQLQEARWLTDFVTPGGVAQLMSVWQVLDPTQVGPAVFPANQTDVVLFTHVLNEDGSILAQQDWLAAPSWDWQTGDIVVQNPSGVHTTLCKLRPLRNGRWRL